MHDAVVAPPAVIRPAHNGVDMEQDRPIDELGHLIMERFDRAKSAKAVHYANMVDALKLVRGEALVPQQPNQPSLVLDVSGPIITNLIALVRDVFSGGSLAKPYTINATPIAELPPDIEQELLIKVEQQLDMLLLMNDYDPDAVRGQIKEMRSLMKIEQNRKAAIAAEKLTEIIADRLHDADWEDTFADFITNYCIYPAAIMKAPAVKEVTSMEWSGSTVHPTRKFIRGCENINPLDFYPAPHAQDIQSAEYVIERRRLTRNDLMDLRNADGYASDVIDAVFEEHPKGAALFYTAEQDNPVSDTPYNPDERDIYDALGYYGLITNSTLAEYGIEFAEDEKYGASEAEIWVVGGRVIKCLLNPHPTGKRPFYKASFERIPGSFWGVSPAMKLLDTQRVCTAAARNLLRNMSFASGVIGEVRKGRVKDGHDVTQIIPNTIRIVEDDGYGNDTPAYRFHEVPSRMGELMGLFDKYHSLAYDLLGIPRVAFGQSTGLGQAGRTSGTVSMLLNQSTKPLKHALRMLEQGIIEPVVQDFIDYELRSSTDPDIRGDIRVYARGVSGLLEQESKNGDLEWALQSLSSMAGVIDPTTQQPLVPASAIQRILYQLFKNKGLSTQGIFPDFDQQEALEDMLGGVPHAPDVNAAMPQLDGRSATAAQTIDTMNGGFE